MSLGSGACSIGCRRHEQTFVGANEFQNQIRLTRPRETRPYDTRQRVAGARDSDSRGARLDPCPSENIFFRTYIFVTSHDGLSGTNNIAIQKYNT